MKNSRKSINANQRKQRYHWFDIRDRSLFLPEGGPVEYGGGSWLFWWAERGAITFLMSWKGGSSVFLFFHFKRSFLCLTMFFLIIWCEYSSIFDENGYWNCVSYAHQMQNFLRQGALLPYNPRQGASFLDLCLHLPHRLSFPQFEIEWCPACE